MEQSGGRLAIESAPGEGTTINVYLPLARTEPVHVNSEPSLEVGLSGGTELILVVEDDADISALVLDTLETLDYSTLAARTGPEALDIIRERSDVALLFSDLVMPGGMDGSELARAARQLRPELKVLLTSGYVPHAGDSDDGREDGFPLLLKPYQPRELARIIRSVLEGTISASVLHI